MVALPQPVFQGIETGDHAADRDKDASRIVPGGSAEETLVPSRENGMAFPPRLTNPNTLGSA